MGGVFLVELMISNIVFGALRFPFGEALFGNFVSTSLQNRGFLFS